MTGVGEKEQERRCRREPRLWEDVGGSHSSKGGPGSPDFDGGRTTSPQASYFPLWALASPP